MATNKNQHFVPRCYLRQFTLDAADKAINLYNVDRNKFVELAPVKNQCSGDYFYGKDPKLEEAIQAVERAYGATVRQILQPGYLLTDDHRKLLRRFWLMQHLRTEAASKRSVEMADAMQSVIDSENPSFRLKIREAVQMAMGVFAESMDIVSDLKVCLVRNRSRMPFVTSDDPAVLTNRWHLHNAKKTGRSFGLHSAGDLLLLPISPSILCVAYDGDMHSISHDRGWAELRNEADADAFNQHQYLNCRANVFVQDRAHFEIVQQSFLRVSALRPSARHRLHYAVLDRTHGDYSRYVAVDHANADPHEEALIHTEVVHASPAAWPRQIAWRVGASVFSNGTGIGYVRRAFTHRSDTTPFKKSAASLA